MARTWAVSPIRTSNVTVSPPRSISSLAIPVVESFLTSIVNVGAEPWEISALTVPADDEGLEADLARIAAFNDKHMSSEVGLAAIGMIELKANSTAAIDRALELGPLRDLDLELGDSCVLSPISSLELLSDPRLSAHRSS